MERIRNFTIEDYFDRQELLAEAIEIVRYADVDLGAQCQSKGINDNKAQLIERLQKLEEEQAFFAPKLDVRRLTKKDFKAQGIDPSRELKAKMKQHNFYQVGIPITLFPKSGWAFTRLECYLEFCPNESDIHQRPIVYELLPDDVWSEILSFRDHLNLGLDADFRFRAQMPELPGKWQALSEAAKAKVMLQTGVGAQLVVGPFSYTIRRAKVRARGRLNVESFWRLDSHEHVDQEDVLLGVVLMVPKTRTQPVNVVGVLKAYHYFQTLGSEFEDWWEYFGEVLKAFIMGGAVISDSKEWQNITR